MFSFRDVFRSKPKPRSDLKPIPVTQRSKVFSLLESLTRSHSGKQSNRGVEVKPHHSGMIQYIDNLEKKAMLFAVYDTINLYMCFCFNLIRLMAQHPQ